MSAGEWVTVCEEFKKCKYRCWTSAYSTNPLYPAAEHATTIDRKEAAEEFIKIVSRSPEKGVEYYNENYHRIGKLSMYFVLNVH
jgi:hypothetical protein